MTIKEHFQIFIKSVRLLFSLSKTFTLCMILGSMISALMPYAPIYFSVRLIDALTAKEPVNVLALYALVTVGIVFALSLLNAYLSSLRSVSLDSVYRSKNWKFSEKAMQMAYESIEDREVSLLRERIKNEMQTGYGLFYLYHTTESMISCLTKAAASLSLTLSFFFIGSISPLLKLAFVCSVLGTCICSILMTKKAEKVQNDFFEVNVELNILGTKYYEYLEDYASGKDIRLYDMSGDLLNMSGNMYAKLSDQNLRVNLKKNIYSQITLFVNYLLKLTTYLLMIYAALLGGITVGSIARYVSCITLLLSSVTGLVSGIQMTFVNNKYLKRFFSYFEIPNNMYQGSLTVEKRDDNEYFVEFRNVSFRYPGTDAWALRHVSLKFKVGEKLAVVGENGSGKTTFIKLLCRLYDPTEGEILLNGVDIKKYDYDEYMSIFSVVFQDFQLFAFSLGQNVAAGMQYDEARVKECLKQAGFGKRLAEMPAGLNTCLYKNFDKDGVEISGGEAQKIALARALYKDAPFIILDEPTAALDPISEYEIYSSFNEIAGEKTAVYISHRLASCRFCDKIAVFSHGFLIQLGSHAALLSQDGGKYAELWQAQAQYYT